MLRFKVTGSEIRLIEQESLASGSVGVVVSQFEFDDEWNDYSRTAVFKRAGTIRDYMQLLDEDNKCVVPWEVLASQGKLLVGVFGSTTKDDTFIRTSRYAYAGDIYEGTNTNPTEPVEPTQNIYEQVLGLATEAHNSVTSVETAISGGSTGQVMTKLSNTDKDIGWVTIESGGGGKQSFILPFTAQDWVAVDDKYKLTISTSQHSLGISATVSTVERNTGTVFTNTTWTYTRSANGTINIVSDIAYDGRAILTE